MRRNPNVAAVLRACCVVFGVFLLIVGLFEGWHLIALQGAFIVLIFAPPLWRTIRDLRQRRSECP